MLSGISWPQLLIVLVIVLALFGGKKLRSLGSDLGDAVKGFRSAMNEGNKDDDDDKEQLADDSAAADADFDNTPVEEPRKEDA